MIDWNDPNNERKLMLACLNREQKGGWEEIASMLGSGFTPSGVRQKFYKLKRESEAIVSKGSNGATPTTASTNKPKKTPKTTPAKGKKRTANDVDNGDGSDGNDPDETPSKKGKKSEDSDGDTKVKHISAADEE